MDYVKETLQRQNGLWLALFGGGREEREAAEPQQERLLRERSAADPAARRSEDTYAGEERGAPLRETAESLRERAETRSERELLLRGRETVLRELAFRHGKAAEAGADQAQGRGQRAETPDAETARWEAEAALREGRNDLETADARAISRRFERDARRYDGGFVFY